MTEPVGALEYHRLTAHHPDRDWPADRRLVRGFQPMQWETRPPPHKTYPGRPPILLPDDLGPGGPAHELDLGVVGRLLFLSAGVVRMLPMPGGPMWFRAAGSAGNLAPVEVYVVTGDLPGLEAGLYHYEPVDHALLRLRRVPSGTPPVLVLTGVPWRTCWKYRERGFRHLWWDAGTMLAHVLAVAADAGLDARVELGFVDAEVAALVGADRCHELPLAVVGLQGPSALPAPASEPLPAGHLADDPFEFPLVTAAYRAGELAGAEEVAAWRAAGAELCAVGPPHDRAIGHQSGGGDPPWPGPLEDVVLRRGSARRFDPGAVAPSAVASDGLPWAAAPVPLDILSSGGTLLGHLLLVHGVDGIEPGAYRLQGGGLVQLGVGDVREVGRYLCLGQRLGGDGALTAFHVADLERVTGALGDRGYRAALLEAGVVEGRLHLAAYGVGLGASGLTFFDDEVSRFFATPATPMLVTAVGVVPYRSRPGGRPRRPARIRAR